MLLLVYSQTVLLEKLGLGPSSLFCWSLYPCPVNPPVNSPPDLTRAPLLSRIMKMMKVSNQLCSTMRKQVFRRIHQDLPSPSSMLTWQHLNLWTQPSTGGRGRSDCGTCPAQTRPPLLLPRPPGCCPTTQHNSSAADSEVERVVGLRLCCQAARARPSDDGKISDKEAVRGRRRG